MALIKNGAQTAVYIGQPIKFRLFDHSTLRIPLNLNQVPSAIFRKLLNIMQKTHRYALP